MTARPPGSVYGGPAHPCGQPVHHLPAKLNPRPMGGEEIDHMLSAYQVGPGGRLVGRLRVPGDKSISHRAIMLGAIADGVTRVSGFLEGADALSTRNVF